ncbi:MAG: serine--tRNA ligase [Rickettsiales bacterium]|nr:serine--tRNA ligase [Rickettsiales bacterium]
MHDIKWIREQPAAFDAALARRNISAVSAEILAIDEKRRADLTSAQELQARRNELAKLAGQAKAKGGDAEPLFAESREIGVQLKAMEEALAGEDPVQARLASLPNLLAADVPDGADESANVELKRVGRAPEFAFAPKEHFDLGEALGLMDFETAAKMSGARFVVLRGALARMERALADFMLHTHTTHSGYEEVVPPYLVRDQAAYGTGQLPKFTEDLFQTTNGYWLVPTAEIPLTNLVADSILDAEQLPMRFTAYSPCFRSEAGSAGRDTRGMIRQHQFSKVELVSIVAPEHSAAEHERMLTAAESILQQLGLHYRVMLLCAGDTGFGAQKTYDIEVWLPGQNTFREISSCSNFGEFQGRRMKARYRPSKGDKKTEFVHTLNGSGLAIGRTMVAILENYQQEDGSIIVPEALRPYMGGMALIKKAG